LQVYRNVYFVTSVSDIPDDIGNSVYVVGTENVWKWAVFQCPCSQGHQLRVNLMRSHSPRWNLRIDRGKISLIPSVVVTDYPCQSHFWMESNRAFEAYFETTSA
jgi:hypothetical protein